MKERINLSLDNITALIKIAISLKNLAMKAEYFTEQDGSITCCVSCPDMCANGKDKFTSEMNLLHVLREHSQAYLDELSLWLSGCPEELPYIYKIAISSDEELLQCLHGGVS